jgi:L-ascorbate metabolism protein UlaG (beta-lactamase superfamily)
MTQNWRGRPLATYETVVNLISDTRTTTGLHVVRAKIGGLTVMFEPAQHNGTWPIDVGQDARSRSGVGSRPSQHPREHQERLMADKQYYLAEEAYFEPLFNQWYAWPHLLPPVTAARHVVNTHRRIMSSFVNNSQLHIMASKEAVMTGGEFLNCSEDQVPDIQALVDRIDGECHDLVALSDAVRELNEMLRAHTSGESLESMYQKVPGPLGGFVELFFDMEHRASFRVFESLMYRSRYYKPELQTISLGLLGEDGDRPFVLSTPRLPDAKHLQVKVDLRSEFIDTLARARETPLVEAEVARLFEGLETKGGLSPDALFTERKPIHTYVPVTSGVRLRYTGHAGFLVETPDVVIAVDPVIASRCDKYADQMISFSELPPFIHYVCLTHNHQDHVHLETLLQLRHKIGKLVVPKNNGGTIADPSLKLMLQQLGFQVIEVDELEVVEFSRGRIVSVPFLGEHGDLHVRSKNAWLIEAAGKRVFFGADSSNPDIRLYENMGSLMRELDAFCIGMECVGAPYTWLYGALHTRTVSKAIMNSRRLNGSDSRQAFDIVNLVRPQQVYIYALGMEPWYKYLMGIDYSGNTKQVQETRKMIDLCAGIGIAAKSLFGKKTIELT